jgi:signal transduction histidine kinase
MNEKDYLYDMLVHDLKGPLSVVATSVASLLSKREKYGQLTEPQIVSLERALRNARRAQVLLNEILEVARSEENLFQGCAFSVEKMVRESLLDVLESYDPHAREKVCVIEDPTDLRTLLQTQGIFMDITGRYRQEPFFHDQKKIQQVVRNLMSNALKYRRSRMEVSISGEDVLVISVSDDGPGIPKKEQKAIYKRFMRGQDGEVQRIEGLGLGLFCVKSMLDNMKGEIILNSREGFGTQFTVRIPSLPTNG